MDRTRAMLHAPLRVRLEIGLEAAPNLSCGDALDSYGLEP
jgi:hypothetical protein